MRGPTATDGPGTEATVAQSLFVPPSTRIVPVVHTTWPAAKTVLAVVRIVTIACVLFAEAVLTCSLPWCLHSLATPYHPHAGLFVVIVFSSNASSAEASPALARMLVIQRQRGRLARKLLLRVLVSFNGPSSRLPLLQQRAYVRMCVRIGPAVVLLPVAVVFVVDSVDHIFGFRFGFWWRAFAHCDSNSTQTMDASIRIS
jgi:hypothetical protein